MSSYPHFWESQRRVGLLGVRAHEGVSVWLRRGGRKGVRRGGEESPFVPVVSYLRKVKVLAFSCEGRDPVPVRG